MLRHAATHDQLGYSNRRQQHQIDFATATDLLRMQLGHGAHQGCFKLGL